jgi:hypothetical protein
MRKAELEEGVAYATKRDGKVTVVDLNPRTPMGAKSPQVGVMAEGGARSFMLAPVLITRRWDDPEEVAKRERKAELDAQSARARELLAALGLTVAYPGRVRLREAANPQSWVESGYDGRRVVIRLDAFLSLFDVPDLAAVVRELEVQWSMNYAHGAP